MKRENNKMVLLTSTAVMTALVCVMTMVIKIPSPTKGYLNLGDCSVLLAGWLLGPLYGAFAAGVGSAFADLISGYFIFVPGTLIIKGLMAVAIAVIPRIISGKRHILPRVSWITASIIAEAIMVFGYYLFSALFIGEGFIASLAGVPGDSVQGVFGAVGAYFLAEIISHTSLGRVYGAFRFAKGGAI